MQHYIVYLLLSILVFNTIACRTLNKTPPLEKNSVEAPNYHPNNQEIISHQTSYVDPFLVRKISRVVVVQGEHLNLSDDDDDQVIISTVAGLSAALFSSAGIAYAVKYVHQKNHNIPTTANLDGPPQNSALATPLLKEIPPSPAETLQKTPQKTPQKSTPLTITEKPLIEPASALTSGKNGTPEQAELASTPKTKTSSTQEFSPENKSPSVLKEPSSKPQQESITPPSPVPAHLQHLALKKTPSSDQFSFEQSEEIALLLLPKSDPLYSALVQSADNRIIRGTTEFRAISEKGADALVTAIDLRPQKSNLINIETTLALGDGAYLPKATYRPDPSFGLKVGFVKELGLRGKPLSLGESGKIMVDEKKLKYRVEEELGSGTHGIVYKVTLTDEQSKQVGSLAIKQAKNLNGKGTLVQDELKEIDFLERMARHPNSIQFFGAYPAGGGHVNIAMEIVDGDWKSLSFSALSFEEKTKLFIGAADGLAAMHAAHLVHYDVKPANILRTGTSAKLGDFGFVLEVTPGVLPAVYNHGTYRSKSLDTHTQDGPGNPFGEDVFALGISMIDARISREFAWSCCKVSSNGFYIIDSDQLLTKLDRNPSWGEGLPEAERHLIERMIGTPENRPSMQEVADSLRQIYKISTM